MAIVFTQQPFRKVTFEHYCWVENCFLYFLDKNNMLYKENIPIIDSRTLFALTLLIAESKPEEMDIMKQIVVSVLNSLAF